MALSDEDPGQKGKKKGIPCLEKGWCILTTRKNNKGRVSLKSTLESRTERREQILGVREIVRTETAPLQENSVGPSGRQKGVPTSTGQGGGEGLTTELGTKQRISKNAKVHWRRERIKGATYRDS